MGLTAEQEVRIRTYFETTYNLYFGVPTERSEGSLTPSDHVMLLQYLQLDLLNYPSDPLSEELLNKTINNDTVEDALNDFLNIEHTPLNPDFYLYQQKNFIDCGDKKNPANSTEIIDHLIKVIEAVSQQMEYGYLKKEDDPKNSNKSSSPLPALVTLGIFSTLALGAGFIAFRLSNDSSPSDLVPR